MAFGGNVPPVIDRSLVRRPLAFAPLLLVIGAASMMIVAGCGGSGNQSSSTEPPPSTSTSTPPPATDTGTVAATAGDPTEGATIYAQKCSPCHGAQGKGDGPLSKGLTTKPRNHTDGAYMKTRTDEDLLQVIRDGKPPMPPWGKVLSEQQMRSVLAYVRTLAK